MFTYNRFQPILIGGTSNIVPANISTIENVSLNVTGDTYLNGQLHVLNLTSDIATSITNNTSQITSLNTRLTADETNITTNTILIQLFH